MHRGSFYYNNWVCEIIRWIHWVYGIHCVLIWDNAFFVSMSRIPLEQGYDDLGTEMREEVDETDGPKPTPEIGV